MVRSPNQRCPSTTLPASSRLPINRCNLPAVILGSLTFQQHPTALKIDGLEQFHQDLFEQLDTMDEPGERARHFVDYMVVHFRLEALDEAGLTPGTRRGRPKANYLLLLRGWMFDTDSREGAVLKGWVESRFGLLPRYHKVPIYSAEDDGYRRYLQDHVSGLYNTNALEAQVDLLYAYCQYELGRRRPAQTHIVLYRGVNGLAEHDWLCRRGRSGGVVLLNSLNSFSTSAERADEFGALVLKVRVPLSKILYFAGLLPGLLGGEEEHMVIGGLYRVSTVE